MRILLDSAVTTAVKNPHTAMIAESVRKCAPTCIAVAFIGTDWKEYVENPRELAAVIVSPTIGTNPRAVTDLAKTIGWERIFLLDELHAKIFIGETSAVVGSANLTKNGLSGLRLIEACVEIRDEGELRVLTELFSELRRRAEKRYPDKEAKKRKIAELQSVWNAAVVSGAMAETRSGSSFLDFELVGRDDFYVVWYQPVEVAFSEDVKAIESVIANDIHFAKGDQVQKHKWALLWHITGSGKPSAKRPYWLYIHELFKNGVVEPGYGYPQCAVQRSDLPVPSPPFEITKEIANAFRKAVQDEDVAKYLVQSLEKFRLKDSLDGVPLLIERMKSYLKKGQIRA
ncbi:phospholipase D family protein [Geomonas sp. RF6]|uniref:phospholipase D family protein n=1 Tax=Geomonas sp. RF6 TaxID=2897342 RepID=UPI001E513FF0|nr:phospholipase D family protein [Geomonas sp. RF6]UFS69506.1 phospholipase D family protein [Geomonas sp. RF6]